MTQDVSALLNHVAGSSGVAAASAADVLVAFELFTMDPDGWPHVAWLGPGEVMPVGHEQVAVAVWPGSSTRANLERDRRGVLQAVIERRIHRIRLDLAYLGVVPVGEHALQGFLGEVAETTTDEVAYAEVLSGLTYRLHDPEVVIARWEEQIVSLAGVVAAHLSEAGVEES